MTVNIIYLSNQGKDNIVEVVEMFEKDRGPLKFKLFDTIITSNYFQYHRSLKKISIENLSELSEKIREYYSFDVEDILVVISQKSLQRPSISFFSNKDWISFYENKNILVKSAGWDGITEGKPYLGIAHQIIENVFQNLGNINLLGADLDTSVHKEVDVCVNDFCENLNETKSKIRSGYICEPCTRSALRTMNIEYVIQIKKILGRISNRLRENYSFDFNNEDLNIEVVRSTHYRDYDIKVGGKFIDFGHKGKLSLTAYLFYLINHNVGIPKNQFEKRSSNPQKAARIKFIKLYEKMYGRLFDDEMDKYVRDIRSVHSRISTRLKNQLSIEDIAHMYGFASEKVSQDVSNYIIKVSSNHLILPDELLEFRL